MQAAASLKSCLQCHLSFPASRLPLHISETHGDPEATKATDGATTPKDEVMEEAEEDYYDESIEEDDEEDMDLDINEDDVKDFLKNLEESKQRETPEEDATANTQEDSLEEAETVPCDMCKMPIKKPDIPNHLASKHDIVMDTDATDVKEVEEPPSVPVNDQLNESLEEDIVLKETCEMCEEKIGIRFMVTHLAEVHFVRVILDPNRSLDSSLNSSLDSSLDSTTNEDPFDLPDFLKKDVNSDIVKFKCHHCQKAFMSSDKLDKHTAKKHEKKCKICHIQKLVQENRYRTILKQLRSAKVGDKQEIPTNSSITSGEFYNKVFSYEELYPETSLSCEECESFFFWPDSSHSCPLVTQNIRVLSGVKVSRGRMISGELGGSAVTGDGDFDYISGTLAQSMVKKMALDLVKGICTDVLEDVLGSVVAVNYNVKPDIEKTTLQEAALELTEKFEERGKRVPDILRRAAKEFGFVRETENVLRKLHSVFVEEYKEDIEEKNKKMFQDREEEKRRIQEEARKEMNQSKYYDYSKYNIPNLKAMKKSKPLFPLQRLSTSLGNSVAQNNSDNSIIGLPSGGSALEATGSTTFLNKLRKQQNRTIKVYNNKRSLLKTKPSQPGPPGLSINSSIENCPSLKSPQAAPVLMKNIQRTLNSPSLTIKIEPGTLSPVASAQIPKSLSSPSPIAAKSQGLPVLKPKTLPVLQQPVSQTPALKVPSSNSQPKKSSAALEKLQSLGLSVTVKERQPLQSSIPQNILPKPQPNIQQRVSTSLLKPRRPLLPTPRVGESLSVKAKVLTQTQNTIFKNQATSRATLQSRAVSKPVVCPPILSRLTSSSFAISNNQKQTPAPTAATPLTNSSQIKTYYNKRKEAIKTTSQIIKDGTTTNFSTTAKTNPGLQKVEFNEKQKLMIKSQMLAYRMLRRRERLPEVVFNAATNKNFRSSSSHSKTDLSYLSSLFKKEYSNLKR